MLPYFRSEHSNNNEQPQAHKSLKYSKITNSMIPKVQNYETKEKTLLEPFEGGSTFRHLVHHNRIEFSEQNEILFHSEIGSVYLRFCHY